VSINSRRRAKVAGVQTDRGDPHTDAVVHRSQHWLQRNMSRPIRSAELARLPNRTCSRPPAQNGND